MSYTRTLAQLRQSFLVRGGYERSSDITPAVANELINDALNESYNLIVERWDDYYTTIGTPVITTAPGTSDYALPTDFYKLRKVEILCSGVATGPQARWERLYPVSIDDSHLQRTLVGKGYKYWIAFSEIMLLPCPQVVETVRVFYIPAAPQLLSDTDTVQFDTPVEQKLVLHIALRDAYQRQDLSTMEIEAKIASLSAQLRTAGDHDAGEPFYLGRRTGDHEAEW